jgi:hypothetical protein
MGFAAGDTNLVRYVGNRILTYYDPSGLAGRGSNTIELDGGISVHVDVEKNVGTKYPHVQFEKDRKTVLKIPLEEDVENLEDFLRRNEETLKTKRLYSAISRLRGKNYEKLNKWIIKSQRMAKQLGTAGVIITVVVGGAEIAQAAEEEGVTGAITAGSNLAKDFAIGATVDLGAGMAANLALGETAIAGGTAATAGTGALVVAAGMAGYYTGDQIGNIPIAGQTIKDIIADKVGTPIGVGAWYTQHYLNIGFKKLKGLINDLAFWGF